MYTHPKWEWFHTRGMCSLTSDPTALAFSTGVYDLININLLVLSLWLLIYALPPRQFMEVHSSLITVLHTYLLGFLVPIPPACVNIYGGPSKSFAFDEIILFPIVAIILLRCILPQLKAELHTWFFWTNLSCLLICTGCVSLLAGRSNLLMVAVSEVLAFASYYYALWTPIILRSVEAIALLAVISTHSDKSGIYQDAFTLSVIGLTTTLLMPLMFTSVEHKSFKTILHMLFVPTGVLDRKNAKKPQSSGQEVSKLSKFTLPSVPIRLPFMFVAYQVSLLTFAVIGTYYYISKLR